MPPHFMVSRVRDRARPNEKRAAFSVEWAINPHMRPGTTCLREACEQHRGLVAALRNAGASVDFYPFVYGCYDSVFAKDSALLLGGPCARRALLARPRHRERAAEQPARQRVLRERGFAVTLADAFLEGGDVVRSGETFLLGHGFRSERRAVDAIARFTGLRVLPLELTDPHLYHLDTALCALVDGTILACKSAFTRDSWTALCAARDVAQVVEIPREEALRFGLNAVQVGTTVVLAGGAPRVEDALAARGLEPHPLALDQFQRAGGSAACLVSEVHAAREDAARAA